MTIIKLDCERYFMSAKFLLNVCLRLSALAGISASGLADSNALSLNSDLTTDFGSPAEVVRIGELTNEPEKFVGKQISVVGLVDDVCPVRGCWANVKDAEDGSRVRFKVPDGELVFTAKMIGDVLEAKGFFARYTLNEIGHYERNMETQYYGEAMYLLEGRDASLICSENQLKDL